jgi:hypothetical protein
MYIYSPEMRGNRRRVTSGGEGKVSRRREARRRQMATGGPGGGGYASPPLLTIGLGRSLPTVGPLGGGEGVAGQPIFSIPGRATRRAGLVAHARHYLTGRASPGTTKAGPSRARTGPRIRAFGQVAGLRAFLDIYIHATQCRIRLITI